MFVPPNLETLPLVYDENGPLEEDNNNAVVLRLAAEGSTLSQVHEGNQ